MHPNIEEKQTSISDAATCTTRAGDGLMEWMRINRKEKNMLATANVENVTLSLPNADLAMLRLISRKMGWKLKTRRKSGLEKALEDVAAGRVYEAKSFDDLLEQLEK